MRAGVVGAYFFDDQERVVAEARKSAQVTHAHPDGQAGAIAVALACAYATWPRAHHDVGLLDWVCRLTPSGPTRVGLERARQLPLDGPMFRAMALGTGERVLSCDTVPFSLYCAARCLDDFSSAMWTTVSGFGDRDTTCAIVGGIAAMRCAIPSEWRAAREPLGRRPPL
jgi:ADP-ribosylglycohydrolase